MSVSIKILEKINFMIAESLKAGKKPWRKTWDDIPFEGLTLSSPVNLVSKTRYRGFNRFILSLHPSSTPVFLTFDQVKKLNGSVNKGAAALPVIYFASANKKVETVIDDEIQLTDKTIVFLKYYNVFNIEDTTVNLDALIKTLPTGRTVETIDSIETIITDYITRENIRLYPSTSQNFYRPATDSIHMVDINQFKTAEDYYSTFLHEAVHSTGHARRLNRFELKANNKKEYAFEELIAETAACYLTSQLNISTEKLLDNSASYIRSWLSALESNPYFFYQAAKQAETAANYILKAA